MSSPIGLPPLPELPIFLDPAWGLPKQPGRVDLTLQFIAAPANLTTLLGDFSSGRVIPSLWAPKTSLRDPFGAVRLVTDPAPPPATWSDFFGQLADNIASMDLDVYRVPVNGGSGGCRLPEFTPRDRRPQSCTVAVQAGTTARIYAEIRPVQGEASSMLTRFIVDYQPNLTYLMDNALLPNLDIDGFEAVTAPEITFKHPVQGPDPMEDVTEVDNDYEAPLGEGGPYHTPFNSVRPPLPGGHHDWMIRFQPVLDTLMAKAEELGANPQGRLLLWPYLLQQGYYEKRDYEALGIRFDTLPRRPGDLVRFFTRLSKAERERRKQGAPYLNPNGEHIDFQGRRQEIPKDPKVVAEINQERQRRHMARLEDHRSKPVDLDFSELAGDPVALAKIKSEDLPQAHAHLRMNEGMLHSPIGEIRVDPGTEIRAHFYLEKSGERWVQINIKQLGLKNIDLNPWGFQIKADRLIAKEAILSFPLSSPFLPQRLTLRGVEGENIFLSDKIKSFHLKLGHAKVDTLTLGNKKTSSNLTIQGIAARGVDIDSPLGRLTIHEAKMAAPLEVDYWHHGAMNQPQELRVHFEKLDSSGKLSLNKEYGTVLETSGFSTLTDFTFYNTFEKDQSRLTTAFGFIGAVESALTKIPSVGTIQFHTVEDGEASPEGGQAKKSAHLMTGRVEAYLTVSHDPIAPKLPIHYGIHLNLPYVGFATEGRLKIPEGGAELRHAIVEIKPEGFEVQGNLTLRDAALSGFGEGETRLGGFLLPEDQPNFEKIHIDGRAHLKFDRQGFSLGHVESSPTPLRLGMDITDSVLNYNHNLGDNWVKNLVSSKIIQSGVHIKRARLEVEDLRMFEYRKTFRSGVTQGNFTKISSGPLTIHHVEGDGVIWAPFPLLNYILGAFPNIGSGAGPGKVKTPNIKPITQHLSPEAQAMIGNSNFFRVEDINVAIEPDHWDFQLRDTVLNVHEQGGPNHYLMLYYPQIFVKGDATGLHPQMGRGNYFANVFLQAKERGGWIRLFRWPISPNSKAYEAQP